MGVLLSLSNSSLFLSLPSTFAHDSSGFWGLRYITLKSGTEV